MFTVVFHNKSVRVYPSILDVCRAHADPNLRIAPDAINESTKAVATRHALSKALRKWRKVSLISDQDGHCHYTIERHG